MSRHHPHDISGILSAAATWQTNCLIADGAVFGVGETWTAQNVDSLFKAYTPQLDEDDRAFLQKLEAQLKGSGQVALLCAEMLWVMYLFPVASHTKPERKRAIITTVASWSGTKIDPSHELLGEPLEAGIGNPGSSFKQRRWTELAYFIKVLRDIKSKPSSERRNLLAFPWAFGRYLDEIAGESKPLLSHMLRYLLFPDRYEPIFTRGDKRRIVAAFRQVAAKDTQHWSTTQLDRELLKVRKEQVAQHGSQALSFYHDPLLSMRKGLEKAQTKQRATQTSNVEPPAPNPEPTAPQPAVKSAVPVEDGLEFYDTVEFNDIIDPDSVLGTSDAGEIVHHEQRQEQGLEQDPDQPADSAACKEPVSYPLNQIFYGPPGTGKTYLAMQRAVEICDGSAPTARSELMTRYRTLEAEQRIRFITLHESYGYDDFVEGIRPDLDNVDSEDGSHQLVYICKPGILKQMANLARHVDAKRGGTFRFDRTRTIWKMSLGDAAEGSRVFDDAIDGGFITLGHGEAVDCARCGSREDIYKRLAQAQPSLTLADYSVSAMHYFCNNMQANDLVVIAEGNTSFRAIGRITGDYQHTNTELSYDHQQLRSVDWLAVYDPSLPFERISTKQFSQRTLYKLDSSILYLDAMERLASTQKSAEPENYVLIVDEMNRGNIPKVFGEVITLLEADKREGAENSLSAMLPFSNQNFSIPANLYLVGTMSSLSDKQAGAMDRALRRRFEFYPCQPDATLIPGADERGNITDDQGQQIDLRALLDTLNQRIQQAQHRDGLIGHAYFMPVKDAAQLQRVINQQVLPTLQAQFHGDTDEVARIVKEVLPEALGGGSEQRRWGSADSIVGDGTTDSPGPIIQ